MNNKKNKNLVIVILASGTGKRAQEKIPKQYFILNNKTLLEININKFLSFDKKNKIVVVVNKIHKKYYKNLVDKFTNVDFIYGSDSRQKSSLNALLHLEKKGYKYIAVHDAARPFFSKNLISKLYTNILKNKSAVIPVIPEYNSIKVCKYNQVVKSLNRTSIFLSQTPQIFDYVKLYNAYKKCKKNLSGFSDDSQVFEADGNKVFTIAGDKKNIKITTKEDWMLKKNELENKFIISVGQGYDVHKFTAGKAVKLFGINIPFKFSLLGHSDADVGIHAIIDALLGSVSAGDIGKIFPDTNKKNKNISSLIMLKKVKKIIKEKNATINHIDCTLIGEKPKISKYTNQMRLNISKILNVSSDSISIKATTTEGLGFTGRKEGLACICNVTVKKKIINT